jgi:hypothetical protein
MVSPPKLPVTPKEIVKAPVTPAPAPQVTKKNPLSLTDQKKRKDLEYYMDMIWRGEYSPKASIQVIWRIFYEPKK